MSTPKAAPAVQPLPSDWITGRVSYTLKDGKSVTFRPELSAGETASLFLGLDFKESNAGTITYGMRELAMHLLEWTVTMPGPDGVLPIPLPPYEPGATDAVRSQQVDARIVVLKSGLTQGRMGQIRRKLELMKGEVAKQYEDDEPGPTGDAGSTGLTSEPASASE